MDRPVRGRQPGLGFTGACLTIPSAGPAHPIGRADRSHFRAQRRRRSGRPEEGGAMSIPNVRREVRKVVALVVVPVLGIGVLLAGPPRGARAPELVPL